MVDSPISEDDAAKSPAPSSSSSKRPMIKVKYSKKEEEERAAAAAVPVEEVIKSHYCKECNKSFHSGKALGGHMSSAHVQANKDYSYKKLSSKKKLSGSYSGSEGFSCGLCRKVFTSEKSLFGHMRCHPERLWRGMVPPGESKIGSSEEEEEDAAHGVGFNLKSWPTSNKRGRGPLVVNPDVNRAHDKKLEGKDSFASGMQIIKLLKGDSAKQDLTKRDIIESSDRGKGKLPEIQDSESSDVDGSIDPNDELVLTAIHVLANARRENNKNNNNHEKRAAAAAEEESAGEKFRCIVCGKLFLTHQALGGHSASHTKFKCCVTNTCEYGEGMPPRKQRKKRDQLPKKSEFAFAFDLNMAPPDHDQEEEGDSSNHTAASS